MSPRRGAIVVGLLLVPVLVAQEIGEVDILLDRLSQYLAAYESELATVIAEEHYEQAEYRPLNRANLEQLRRRTTTSDIAFLRLPDGSRWFGVRDVRTVDGKPVETSEARLGELLKRLDAKTFEQAARIAAESAQYNLGGPRTINMPTTALEVLHPIHHVRYIFKIRRGGRIEGRQTRRIDFEEFDEPTIVSGGDGAPAVFIHGSAWIEPGNGRLWRVELTLKPKANPQLPRTADNRLRVDFTFHPTLKMMVPAQMDETFWIRGGRGQGQAKYSNFRQFTTSARIIPQG